jgi:hypothetical protein
VEIDVIIFHVEFMLIDGSWSVAVVGQNFTPKPKLSRKV